MKCIEIYTFEFLGVNPTKRIMAEYRISGVWRDLHGAITHYAFHTKRGTGVVRAAKKTKMEAISLVEDEGNSTMTWVWNYLRAEWDDGEVVKAIGVGNNKYLRSNPDNELTDNLEYLIDYDWIFPQ